MSFKVINEVKFNNVVNFRVSAIDFAVHWLDLPCFSGKWLDAEVIANVFSSVDVTCLNAGINYNLDQLVELECGAEIEIKKGGAIWRFIKASNGDMIAKRFKKIVR